MEASAAKEWGDFLVAAAGAAGALAGLVFVALSINLNRILSLPGVPGRAGETVMLLAGALIAALLALIPGQSSAWLGLTLLAVGLLAWSVPTVIQIQTFRKRQYYTVQMAVFRFLLYQTATLPLLLSGLSLQRGRPTGGMQWLASFVVLSLIVALFNAWVLLVEIMR
jgi:hypothetical protein